MACGDRAMSQPTDRYARQMILPEIGSAGQAKIRAAHVLVVGAGGLGVPVVQYLVGAGIGRITLVDADRIETSNLHRQPIFGPYIGRFKAEAAADFAKVLNPEVRVDPHVAWLTPENAARLVADCDLALDCADSFAASYILSDYCKAAGKPLISASALGLAGYVGGFCGDAPSLRAVFPDLPQSTATCATAGVLGPLVGMIGMLQAQMALAHLTGLQPSPLGQMIRYDMQGFRTTSFRFDGAPEPEVAPFAFVSKADLTPNDLVIELRDSHEAPLPATPNAIRTTPEALRPTLADLPHDRRLVFACRSGLRAWRAGDLIRPDWHGDIALLADPPDPK